MLATHPHSAPAGWGFSSALSQQCTALLASMRNLHVVHAIGFGLAASIGFMALIHTTVAHLEQAAANQCATRDWPAAKDAAMSQWCLEFEATRAVYGRY